MWIDKGIGGIPPNGYKKIRCHMIYGVKYDGGHLFGVFFR
jgi:hypothetical protein